MSAGISHGARRGGRPDLSEEIITDDTHYLKNHNDMKTLTYADGLFVNPVTPAQAGVDEDKAGIPGRRATPSSLSSSSFGSVEYTTSSNEHFDGVQKDLIDVFASIDVHQGGKERLESDEESIGKRIWRPDDSKEPILMDNDERFCLLPVKYHKAYEYYKMAQASYWTVEEVDLSQDKRDWDRLTAHEKHFISYVLAFFAASDGIVLENLAVRFMQGMWG